MLSSGREAIRVVIADDHELVRYGLRMVLGAESDIEVVGEAPDGLAALELVKQLQPAILLLDLHMPRLDGIGVCRELAGGDGATRIIILTSFDGDDEVFGALEAGASAYIMKDVTPDVLVQSVRSVAEGQMVLAPSVAQRAVAPRSKAKPGTEPSAESTLSERELEVLRLMARGMNNREIAGELWISQTTVKTHISHILRKLGQRDRTQAILCAITSGLVEVPRKE